MCIFFKSVRKGRFRNVWVGEGCSHCSDLSCSFDSSHNVKILEWSRKTGNGLYKPGMGAENREWSPKTGNGR